VQSIATHYKACCLHKNLAVASEQRDPKNDNSYSLEAAGVATGSGLAGFAGLSVNLVLLNKRQKSFIGVVSEFG